MKIQKKNKRFILITLIHSCILLAISVFPFSGNAEEFHNALSFQGFTGLINIPNAEVTAEGKFYAVYDDQKDSEWRRRVSRADNVLFSVGFLPYLELGGRFTEAPYIDTPGALRDISANAKVQVPFIPKGYHFPSIAFGVQDAGGGKVGALYFQSKYVVATQEFWRFRMSVGYGTGPDRMKGVFYGAELKTFDWLYLIGENDTRERNLGARVVTPDLLGFPVNLQLTAKTSLDYRPGHMEYGIGLQIPLGRDYNNKKNLTEKKDEGKTGSMPFSSESLPGIPQTASESVITEAGVKNVQPGDGGLQRLLARLTHDGFENVRVGVSEHELLVVEYENDRYNHNELDGLGVVLGIVTETIPSGFDMLRLVIRKKGIRILQLSAPLELFRAFLHDPGKYTELNSKLRMTPDVDQDTTTVAFIEGPVNPSWLKSTLVIYPNFTTVVGSEVGAFDYVVSAKLDYYLNTWKGSVLNARRNIPFYWTKNFDDNKSFENRRGNNELERLMLFQAVRVSPHLTFNLGWGMVLHDAYGMLNEAAWAPGDGTHRFSARQARVTSNQGVNQVENTVYLGSYRYHYDPMDLYLEFTAGRFYFNDKGFSLETKRFFGDTAISFIYKNTLRADQYRNRSGDRDQMVGLQIALPLTPRRDMKPGLLQVKGYEAWTYLQETKTASVSNYLVPVPVALNPTPAYNIDRVFYNRDRLSEPYIRTHLLRLRDAFITYKETINSEF